MAKITLKGNPFNTSGELPKVGTKAPDFTLTKTDLSDLHLKDLKGKGVVLNVFPSVDTPVCAASIRQFNERASRLKNAVVLCVSRDLPFALKRFCGTEGIERVIPVSTFRSESFAKDYGLKIVNGPLSGLCSRAVVVIDPKGKIAYTEQVPEIGQEPNYDAALKALSDTREDS